MNDPRINAAETLKEIALEKARAYLPRNVYMALSDAITHIASTYGDVLLPSDWDNRSRGSRQGWFLESDEIRAKGTIRRRYVSAVEVWAECLGKAPESFPRQDKREINAILRQLPGWEEEPGRQRCGPYGKQIRFSCRYYLPAQG